MRVLIVDDEAPARDRLQRMVDELDGYEVGASVGNGRAAVEFCRDHDTDIVLLDIRMPGMDGLEAARHLAKMDTPPAVIFTTAYSEHALEAFEAQALDYLLKPVRKERLQQALERARRMSKSQAELLDSVEEQTRSHVSTSYNGNVQLIPVADITYFLAADKYVTAYHRNGEALLDESLKSLEEALGDTFVRIHRNALVARSALIGMERDSSGSYHAKLKGTDVRPEISRRHASDVRALLKTRG